MTRPTCYVCGAEPERGEELVKLGAIRLHIRCGDNIGLAWGTPIVAPPYRILRQICRCVTCGHGVDDHMPVGSGRPCGILPCGCDDLLPGWSDQPSAPPEDAAPRY